MEKTRFFSCPLFALYDKRRLKLYDVNVSPGLFQTATYMNEFLYCTGKAGYENAGVQSLIEKPYSPVYDTSFMIREASEYYRVTMRSWACIQSLYPDVIL